MLLDFRWKAGIVQDFANFGPGFVFGPFFQGRVDFDLSFAFGPVFPRRVLRLAGYFAWRAKLAFMASANPSSEMSVCASLGFLLRVP